MRFAPAFLALAFIAGCGGDPEPQDTGDGAKKPEAAPAWDLAAAVQRKQLPNGLTLLVREKHSAPVVTCELAFKVGAVDERDGERGMAHFLEHMLFKGSTSFKKGEIDLFTMKNGGQNNAYTGRDMTAYHFTMPAAGLDAALRILSEMLGQSTLDEKEFEAEKGPVFEELHAGQDEPWDRLWEAAMMKVYTVHPYHHPIIGYEEELKAMKRDAMKGFYDKYYKPANAVLVIVGDVDGPKTVARVEEMFGRIERGTPVPELKTVEPPQEKEIRFENKEEVEVDRMVMAWRAARAGEPDDYVLDVASAVLGKGRMARLHQRLVEKDGIASDVGVTNYSGRFPGTFLVTVEALPGADRAKIEAAIDEEIARLASDGPTKEELERARNGVMASFIYRAESSSSLADLIATYACTMTLEDLGGYVGRLEKITEEDVKAAAKRYFRREARTTGWSVASGGAEEGGGGGGGGGGKRSAGTRRHGREPGSPAGGGVSLAAAKRVVLDSGLVLLLLENHDLPIVSVQTFSRASQLYESEDQAGLANLVGMLLEDGTKGRTADQIAAAMEFVGGRLGTGSSGVEATVLAKDAGLALDILFDILMNASFPEDMVDQKKEQVLAEIAGARDVPREQARNAYAELLYGRHPLHRPAVGYEDTVKSLTRDDCVRHFRKYFIPNNTIVALVGDFDAAAIEAGIRERTASWKMQLLDLPGFAEAAKLEKGVTKGVPLPNAKQLNVYMGHLGIRRSDPDYYALLVMDNVLGTGAGFTDRMSRTIRDEMGLVYAVGANITGSAGIEPGTFRVFLATVPEKYVAARGVVAKEIERIRKEPVTADELSSAKAYLTGSFVFDFESNAQLADALLYVERHGLGLDYMKTYVEKVKSVTAEDVLRVAAKHLDPAALSVVVAGPVDEKGELTGGK